VSASGRWRWSPGRITDLRSASPSAQATPARHAERDDRGRHCVAAAYNLVRVREPEETASPGPFAGRCRIIGMDDWDGDFYFLSKWRISPLTTSPAVKLASVCQRIFLTSATTPLAKATPRNALHHSGREQEGSGPAVGHTQTGLAAFQIGSTLFGAMERERPQPRRDFPAAPLIGYHASCVQRSSRKPVGIVQPVRTWMRETR
jgi:hypothetical protein